MTAINVMITEEAALLFTDGLASSDAGAPGGTVCKAHPMPHLRTAIATRGGAELLGVLPRMIGYLGAQDFDSLRQILPPAMARLKVSPADGERLARALTEPWDIVCAGWSAAADGPAAFLLSNHDKHGFTPFEALDVGHVLVTPKVPDEAFAALAANPTTEAMIDVMRVQAGCEPSVGAFCQITAVGRQSIETGIVAGL